MTMRDDLLRSLPAGELLLVPVGTGMSWLLGWALRDCVLVRLGTWEYDDTSAPRPDPKVLVSMMRGQHVLVFHEGTPGKTQVMRLREAGEPFWAQTGPADAALFDGVGEEEREAILTALRERWPAWSSVFDLAAVDVLRKGDGLNRAERRRLGLMDRVRRRFR